MEILLFEIPVYIRSFDQQMKESDIRRSEFLAMGRDAGLLDKDEFDRKRVRFEQLHWKPWRYNDIIAWIRLMVDITKITAEVHRLDSKKLRKDLIKKTFRYHQALEVGRIDHTMDSNIIAQHLTDAVDRASEAHHKQPDTRANLHLE